MANQNKALYTKDYGSLTSAEKDRILNSPIPPGQSPNNYMRALLEREIAKNGYSNWAQQQSQQTQNAAANWQTPVMAGMATPAAPADYNTFYFNRYSPPVAVQASPVAQPYGGDATSLGYSIMAGLK